MPNKMERFTQRARRVLSLTQEEAEALNHNYIGPEHFLVALIREEGGVAGRVLHDLGLEQRRVEEWVEQLSQAKQRTTKETPDLSDGTKRVLELGVSAARKLGHQYIGTEHLLLGLLLQSDEVAMEILKRCGVRPDEVREGVSKVFEESPVQPANPPEPEVAPKSKMPVPSLEPARRMGFPSQSQVMKTWSFQILQSAIARILDMVEANRLTSAQAAELLAGLQPYLVPSTSEAALLVAQSLGATLPKEKILHVIVRDSASGTIKLEVNLPLVETLENLDG
ncbi:MAG: Clp protease N-terminal domain-containing protein [Chloroflexota bacterium]